MTTEENTPEETIEEDDGDLALEEQTEIETEGDEPEGGTEPEPGEDE